MWFKEPAIGHYPDYKPLLPAVLAVCFALGIVYNLSDPARADTSTWRCCWAIIVPFTNSAATDMVDMGHRLTPHAARARLLAGAKAW